MTDYGNAPASDEIEVSLFGPGYGEAIAVHLGEGNWFLVDSCLDPETKDPATSRYLDSLQVGLHQVKGIVASHWHDDHVKGLSKLVQKYSQAEFFFSAVFNNKESLAFLSAHGGSFTGQLNSGASELYAAITSKSNYTALLNRCTVFSGAIGGDTVSITSFSPMSSMLAQAYAHFAQYLPIAGGAINNAPPAVPPNLEAVVLHVDFGSDAVLLGADLEDHKTGGWTAVVNDCWVQGRRPSSLYKVAHHGSITGHHSDIWSRLLAKDPVACMTPFGKGVKPLPAPTDIARIKGLAKATYLSSPSRRKPDMDRKQLTRLQGVCRSISVLSDGFGVVRMRKKTGEEHWRVDLFGRAAEV